MSTSLGLRLRLFITRPAVSIRQWTAVTLVATALLLSARQPSMVDLEALDPALMKAVQASVSQRDVQAILSDQRASGPVHLQLYTLCDEAQRCTIFSTMDFPGSASRPSTISLQVAMQVAPDANGVHRAGTSTWQVRLVGPAVDEHINYAGDFCDLTALPRNGGGAAIAGLLTSIQSSIAHVLLANGVIAKPPHVDDVVAAYR